MCAIVDMKSHRVSECISLKRVTVAISQYATDAIRKELSDPHCLHFSEQMNNFTKHKA